MRFGRASDGTSQTQTGCRMLASVPASRPKTHHAALILAFLRCPLRLPGIQSHCLIYYPAKV